MSVSIYAGFGVPEIWRYDGNAMWFYELSAGQYREIIESRSLPRLTSALIAESLDHGKRDGQTAAVKAFRERLRRES